MPNQLLPRFAVTELLAPMLALVLALVLALPFAGGCIAPNGADQVSEGPHALPGADNKAVENYITIGKQEFDLFGEAQVQLPDNFYGYREIDQGSVAHDAASERYGEIWSYINQHIENRLEEANSGGWRNLWGVFGPPPGDPEYSMFWRHFYDDTLDHEAIEITNITGQIATFRFSLGFLGSPEFYEFLADRQADDTFTVIVPDAVLGDRESVQITMRPSPSSDAFPHYEEMFQDGVFDVGVHLGGDYNEGRYDLVRGRWFVDEFLLEEGWVSSTGERSFNELTLESGPFVKQLVLEGRPVEARVYVTHSDMSDSRDGSILRAPIEESFLTRDVVIYAGHAGPGNGLIYDYQPTLELNPGDLAARDEYQIFVFQGCETYHTLVADLLDNPAKGFHNMDVVTTFNKTPFSAGYQVLQAMVELLTLASESGDHHPVSWLRILERLNQGPGEDVQYGVHGIDQDPQLNPNGSAGVMCTPCTQDADCPGGGNFCLQLFDGGRCGVACTTNEACGPEASCLVALPDQPDLPRQCVPRGLRCE